MLSLKNKLFIYIILGYNFFRTIYVIKEENMLCKYCNAELSNEAIFCSNCGKKQEELIDEKNNVQADLEESAKINIENKNEENIEKNGEETNKSSHKKSKKMIYLAIIALLVITGFIVFMLKISIDFEKEQKEVFYVPSIAYKKGDTYAIIDDKMKRISKDKINFQFNVETDSYILLLQEDKLHTYVKDEKKEYVSKNVKDFKISMDGENILLLNKNNKLFYGQVTNIKNLNKIAKDVEKFTASSDLEAIFVKNRRIIKGIDKDGKENDFKKDDILNFSMSGNRFLVYITKAKTNNNLSVYDIDLEKDVYKDSIDKTNYKNLETNLLKKDGSILVTFKKQFGDNNKFNQSIYIITPDKKEEINEAFVGLWGNKYANLNHLTKPILNDNDLVLLTENTLFNLDNFNETYCDRAFMTGKYLSNLKDDNTVEILDSISLKTTNSFKIDLYDNEEVEFIYTISDDEAYVKTNLSFYYYTDDSYKDLKLHKNDILNLQKNATNETHFYIIDEDEIEYIDKDDKKLIYDGKDIIAYVFSSLYHMEYTNKENEAFILDRDNNLFSLQGKEIKLIADHVESFNYVFNNGIVFLKDKKFYLYKNTKTSELGQDYEFRNFVIKLYN